MKNKTKAATLEFKQAEELLSRIREVRGRIEAAQEACRLKTAEIEAEAAAVIAPEEQTLAALDTEIKAFMAENKGSLFGKSDIVNLQTGDLLRETAVKVRIPRNALALIEAQGWLEAVHIAKSVDRDVVKTWPDERLIVIGARRNAIEQFTYQINGGL